GLGELQLLPAFFGLLEQFQRGWLGSQLLGARQGGHGLLIFFVGKRFFAFLHQLLGFLLGLSLGQPGFGLQFFCCLFDPALNDGVVGKEFGSQGKHLGRLGVLLGLEGGLALLQIIVGILAGLFEGLGFAFLGLGCQEPVPPRLSPFEFLENFLVPRE